jgi:hypothetical protein
MNLYEKAIKAWGPKSQQLKCIEELGELSADLARHVNGHASHDLLGEIADVVIMLEQLKLMFPDWEKAFKIKYESLEKRLSQMDSLDEMTRISQEAGLYEDTSKIWFNFFGKEKLK